MSIALFGTFECHRMPAYILAQIAGAFCATALFYGLYSSLFFDFEQAQHMTRGSLASLELASVLSTSPHASLSISQAFLVEVVITATLPGMIMALTGDGNGLPHGPLALLLMRPLSGFAMNPAPDFGPKLMTFFAGWGEVAFTGWS